MPSHGNTTSLQHWCTQLKHITYHHPPPTDHTICISPIGLGNKNGSSGPLPTDSDWLRTSPIPSSFLFDSIFRHIHKIAKEQLLASTCLSVCLLVHLSSWNNSAPTGWIFMEYDIWVFFRNLPGKFKIHLHLTRITGTLHEELHTFITTCHRVLLRIRNISD